MIFGYPMENEMKYPFVIVGGLCLGLAACASPNEGNPDGAGYVGAAGSVYDASANPPRTIGAVTYDPSAPLPADTQAMGTSGSSMPATVPAAAKR
jgi:hypothetical protein